MRGYPVYRLRPDDSSFVRVGSVIELRRSRRSMNRVGLIKLARDIFATGPQDVVVIGPESVVDRDEILDRALSALSAG